MSFFGFFFFIFNIVICLLLLLILTDSIQEKHPVQMVEASRYLIYFLISNHVFLLIYGFLFYRKN